MSSTDTAVRQVLLSVSLTVLIVTAGCAGILSDGGQNSGKSSEVGTSTPTVTLGQQNNSSGSPAGADLRSISIPDNGSVTAAGELDRGDPRSGNKYYEPVQVAAAEGQIVNITMRASSDSRPAIRVRNPDGNVTETISNESGNATGFIRGKFTQTGQFTIEATSVNQDATFNYTLTIEPAEPPERDLFEGDMSEWNETEQYLEFTRDFGSVVGGSASQLGAFPDTQSAIREEKITANASGDYAVYTYEVSSDLNFTQRNKIAVSQMVAYTEADRTYREELANDGTNTEDGSWVPEIIFLQAVDEDTGELLRAAFLTREWARDFAEADNETKREDAIDIFAGNYYSTLRYGPGSQYYDADEPGAITESEFPQLYWNYTYPADNTTLAEKYGL